MDAGLHFSKPLLFLVALTVVLVALRAVGIVLMVAAVLTAITPFTALLCAAIANPEGRLTAARYWVLGAAALGSVALDAVWIGGGLAWHSFPWAGFLIVGAAATAAYRVLREPAAVTKTPMHTGDAR